MTAAYQIPSYKIDETPDLGIYLPPQNEMRDWMADALASLRETGTANVPNMPGFIIRGSALGEGFHFTIIKVWSDTDGAEHEMRVTATLFAPRDEDAAAVSQAALQKLPSSAVPPHPAWVDIMSEVPTAPFTAIVPHEELLHGAHAGHITAREIILCTGFSQFFVGHALDVAKVAPLVEIDDIDEDDLQEEISGQDIAIAVQTGGVRGNVLIVEKGEDGYPEVYAYVGDIELDVVRVDFDAEGAIKIDADGMKYLSFDADTLTLLSDLAEEAEEVWEEACDLLDELEEEIIAAEEEGVATELHDPLEHLYTEHALILVDEETTERFKQRLGIDRRYNIEA